MSEEGAIPLSQPGQNVGSPSGESDLNVRSRQARERSLLPDPIDLSASWLSNLFIAPVAPTYARPVLPDEVVALYKRARECFVNSEERSNKSALTRLGLFRDCFEALIEAAANPDEEDSCVRTAVDALGRAATILYEERTRKLVNKCHDLHRIRRIRGLFRSVPSDDEFQDEMKLIRDNFNLRGIPQGQMIAESSGLDSATWIARSKSLEDAYDDARRLHDKLTIYAPLKFQPLGPIVVAVSIGLAIVLAFSATH